MELKKERGDLCLSFRKIHHNLSKRDIKKIGGDEAVMLV